MARRRISSTTSRIGSEDSKWSLRERSEKRPITLLRTRGWSSRSTLSTRNFRSWNLIKSRFKGSHRAIALLFRDYKLNFMVRQVNVKYCKDKRMNLRSCLEQVSKIVLKLSKKPQITTSNFWEWTKTSNSCRMNRNSSHKNWLQSNQRYRKQSEISLTWNVSCCFCDLWNRNLKTLALPLRDRSKRRSELSMKGISYRLRSLNSLMI